VHFVCRNERPPPTAPRNIPVNSAITASHEGKKDKEREREDTLKDARFDQELIAPEPSVHYVYLWSLLVPRFFGHYLLTIEICVSRIQSASEKCKIEIGHLHHLAPMPFTSPVNLHLGAIARQK